MIVVNEVVFDRESDGDVLLVVPSEEHEFLEFRFTAEEWAQIVKYMEATA